MPLTGRQKRFLRAQAHGLKPLVQVGKLGIAGPVISQADQCLTAHELLKVKVLENCPLDRHACGAALAEATHSEVAQTIGRMVLLYRADPLAPRLQLPEPAGPPLPEEGSSAPVPAADAALRPPAGHEPA